MIDLKNISRIYFIGIGGIGMSALARYFSSKGVTVSGYDKTETNLSKQLEKEGIKIHYTDDINLLDKDAQLIVYTPAVPKEQKEFVYYQQNNYPLLKRSDVLGKITDDSFNICVAGTHGKTTISAMIAHILRDSGYGCNAFLGGVSVNYNTNFWSSEKNVCVIEADEYLWKDWVLPLVIAVLVVSGTGLIVQQLLLRWNQGQELRQALITIALSLIIADQIVAHFVRGGAETMAWPNVLGPDKQLALGRFSYPGRRLFMLLVAIGIGLGLLLWLHQTRTGLVIRAGVDDRHMVRALGIHIERVFAIAFVVGAALAALGGVVGASFAAVDSGVDGQWLLNSLVVVI